MSPLNVKLRLLAVSVCRNTNNNTFQESSGNGRDGSSRSVRNNQVRKTNGNTITNGNTDSSKTGGANTNSLVCQVINKTEFYTVRPLTRSLGSVVPTGVSLIVLFIIVVVLDFQSAVKIDINASISIVQSCTVSSYNFKDSSVSQIRSSGHPVLILSIGRQWLTKGIDKFFFCSDVNRVVNRSKCKRSSNCTNII